MRLMIVDDHQLFLEGIKRVLEDIAAEVHCYEDPLKALQEIEAISPDLLLLDITMPGLDGENVIRALAERQLLIPAVVVTATEDTGKLQAVLDAGAQGIIPKQSDPHTLKKALNRVWDGGIYIPADIQQKLDMRAKSPKRQEHYGLSNRQMDVLELLAKGRSNKQIAMVLNVSEQTVKSHLKVIYQVLYVSSRTEAVSRALELGLIA